MIRTEFDFLTSIKNGDDMKFLSQHALGLLFTFLACLMTGDIENIFHSSFCCICWTSVPEPYLPSLTSSTIVPVFNHSLYHGAPLYISGSYYCQDLYSRLIFKTYMDTYMFLFISELIVQCLIAKEILLIIFPTKPLKTFSYSGSEVILHPYPECLS